MLNEKNGHIYVVKEREHDSLPICGMMTASSLFSTEEKEHSEKICRLLLGMRNALSNKFMLQLLLLPKSISQIVAFDTQDDLCRSLVDKSIKMLGGSSGSLWLRSRDSKYLDLKAISSVEQKRFGPSSSCSIGLQETWLLGVLNEAKPDVRISANRASEPEELVNIDSGITARITLGIPLIFQNHSVGVICIYSPEYYFFLPTDILAAFSFATSAVPSLESFRRLELLSEIEACTGKVLRAREGMGEWLESVEKQVGMKTPQQWSLLLKDPETEMVESVAEHAQHDWKSFKRLCSVRHHISSDNIHPSIIKNNAIEVIRGEDPRFDTFIQQQVKREPALVRLFMPLHEKPTGCIQFPEPKPGPKLDDSVSYHKIYRFDTKANVIGTLVIRRVGEVFTDDEVKSIHETVRDNIQDLSLLTLRGALLQLAEILRYLSKARQAILSYGWKKDDTSARVAKVGEESGTDSFKKTFRMKFSDKEVGKLELIFNDGNQPRDLEKKLVETFLGILSRLLEALRDRRRSSNKGNFLFALSLAIESFHDNHNVQDFIYMKMINNPSLFIYILH